MSNDTKGSEIYDDRHINYAKAKAYIEVTVETLQKDVTRWRVFAAFSILGAMIAIIVAGVVILKKEFIPILVKYNEQTGQTIVSTVNAQEIESLSAMDALNKYWITKFITCAETYDKKDQLRLYECVRSLTNKSVFNDYRLRFERSDKDNWFERYGKGLVTVNVISINKIEIGEVKNKKSDEENPRWIIKYEKLIKGTSGKEPLKIPYSAVVETKFETIARNEKDIRKNPLNFKVYSYRVDRETTKK